MAYEHILFDEADGVATLTINRPERMNALHVGVIAEMIDAVDRVRDAVEAGGTARVLTISAQLAYAQKDKFRSTLKGDFFRYGLDALPEAWGRPRLAGTWSNSYVLNKKLFVTADLYFFEGIKNQNPVSNLTYTLRPIYDANLKIDYFLGKQISAFVSLNNIFGQNYQRYLYYQQQGLNFLGGISYSF